MVSIREAQNLSAKLLEKVQIESFMLDSQLILSHITNKSRINIQLEGNTKLTCQQKDQFFDLLKRRLCFEPMAYLLGVKEFYGYEFIVSKDCLIPRPDTEIVVEECLKLLDDNKKLAFELCTGSGAIAISLLRERKNLNIIASDISKETLEIAKLNAKNLGVADRLELNQGDLFACFKKIKADLIVINPPYIETDEILKLTACVREYEPHLALDGGPDGLNFYRRILKEAPDYLASSGFLVMEIGFDQKEKITSLIDENWSTYRFFKDLASLDRVIVLQKR
jgi:release factor glutamine methyltransferase